MQEEDTIGRLYDLGEKIRSGIAAAIDDTGVSATVVGLGSQWCVYFMDQAPRNFREAMAGDADRFQRYHASLLEQGVLEPAFPTGDRRLNASTSEADIQHTLESVHQALLAAK